MVAMTSLLYWFMVLAVVFLAAYLIYVWRRPKATNAEGLAMPTDIPPPRPPPLAPRRWGALEAVAFIILYVAAGAAVGILIERFF